MFTFRPATVTLAVLSLAGLAQVALAQSSAKRDTGAQPATRSVSNTRTERPKFTGDTLPSKAKPVVTRDNEGDGNPVAFWLHVLHVNDGETKLISAPGQPNYGGAARMKTLVDNLRTASATLPASPEPRGVVMISSGDNFLAGAEWDASLSRLPISLPFYDSIALDAMGFDAMTIGNHEFDFGTPITARFISGFASGVPFITSNLDFVNVPEMLSLVNANRVRKSTIVTIPTVNGPVRVGIVGATTTDLPFVSSPGATIINPLLPAIQNEVDRLRNIEGVSKIILSSHLQSLSSEFSLIPQLRGVDVVIAGGGSELLANPGTPLVPGDTIFAGGGGGTGYPRTTTDADGRTVYIVTTNGNYKYVGRLIVGFDAAGEIIAVNPASGPVRVSGNPADADRVTPDAGVFNNAVLPVSNHIAALAANVIATTTVPLDGVRNNIRTRETNQGNLGADALFYNASVFAANNNLPLPDVALQNSGGIRNESVIGPTASPSSPVNITELNTFQINAFSNFVAIVPNISRAQFKEILENSVSLIPGANGRFAQVAGFQMVYETTGRTAQVLNAANAVTTPGTRVRDVVLNDGTVLVRNGAVVPGPAITIATIDFSANGGDQYPFRGAPFIRTTTNYQIALEQYITQWLGGRITAEAYPAGGEGRIIRR